MADENKPLQDVVAEVVNATPGPKPTIAGMTDSVAATAVDVLTDKVAREEAEREAAKEAAAKASTSANLKVAVAEKLANLSSCVRDSIVTALAEEQLANRIEAAMKMINMLAKLDIDLRKARKVEDTFNEDGSKREPVFTKEQIESIKKLNEQKTKYENALQTALDNGSYDKLMELTK